MKTCSRQGLFELGSINHSARSGGKIGISFSIFFNINVFCVFSLETPHRGDSNEYIQYTVFNIKRKPPLIIPNLQLWDFFQGTQEQVQNAPYIGAIKIRLLYLKCANYCKFLYSGN